MKKEKSLPNTENTELNDEQLDQCVGGVLKPIQVERYTCINCLKDVKTPICPTCGKPAR